MPGPKSSTDKKDKKAPQSKQEKNAGKSATQKKEEQKAHKAAKEEKKKARQKFLKKPVISSKHGEKSFSISTCKILNKLFQIM